MLRRYFGLLKKDFVTAHRNYYFVIVITVAVIFVLLANFVLPEEASIKPSVYYHIDFDGDLKNVFQNIIASSQEKHENIYAMSSKEAIIENMRENANSFGMIIETKNNKPSIHFIMQGHENSKVVNTLLLAMKDEINKSIQDPVKITTIQLKKGIDAEKIPTNKKILPLFLLMEPAMLGFVLIAALIFMEKDERTVSAYRVTPGKLPEYLASKITLMLVLGWISTLVSTYFVVGRDADYLRLFLLVSFGSIFASSMGLILASFFDNISQSVIWMIIISLFISLPFVSYFVPSFAPMYVRFIPTYPLLFALREVLFPSGNMLIVTSTLITFILFSIGGYLLAIFAYQRNFLKD
ncbi:ABC transporter permease [Clostridiaceae bacterium 35-E11]